jgi:hypothetical protein
VKKGEAAMESGEKFREALLAILRLDPNVNSEEGSNEWGEADCFHQAQRLAADALGPIEHHYVAHADNGIPATGPLSEKAAHEWIEGMSHYIVDAKAKYDVRRGMFNGFRLLDEEVAS